MREDFLHYLWKFRKFDFQDVKTTAGESVVIIDVGRHNKDSGPDFFNARLRIGHQLWAGNVEIHLKSSDWYFHGHEIDDAYRNVILHVVWEDDVEIFRTDGALVPTMILKKLVDSKLLNNYYQLFAKEPAWINCESQFSGFDSFRLEHFLERLYLERLEERYELILNVLKNTLNNWEALLFRLLCRNFGLKVNADSFLSMAESIDFKIIQKHRRNLRDLEALFLGQAGLLEDRLEIAYYQDLQSRYAYLKHKYKLENSYVIKPKYFRLRPDNFPTLRLAQLAALYYNRPGLFSRLISAESMENIYKIFEIEISSFWSSHYSFLKEHNPRPKKLTKNFIDLLVINTVIPVKFAYGKYLGNPCEEELLDMMSSLAVENNSVIEKFNELRPGTAENAMETQALLQLKNSYCDKNRCLECSLGISLLQK